jgi:hypothetical protein
MDAETLRALASGRISTERSAAIEAHLMACHKCLVIVSTAARNRGALAHGGLGDTVVLEAPAPCPRRSTRRLAMALSFAVVCGSAVLWQVGADTTPSRMTNVETQESIPSLAPSSAHAAFETSETGSAAALATPPTPRIAPAPSESLQRSSASPSELPSRRTAAAPKSSRNMRLPAQVSPRAAEETIVHGRRIRTTL